MPPTLQAIPALRRFSDYLNQARMLFYATPQVNLVSRARFDVSSSLLQTSTSLPSGSPVWLLGDEYTLSSDEGPSAATGRTQVSPK